MKIAEATLLNWLTAAGVTIILVDDTGSLSIAIDRDMEPTVPPVGTAILPEKNTLYLARH